MPQTPRYPEALTVGDVLALLRSLRGDMAPAAPDIIELFDRVPAGIQVDIRES